MAKTIIVGGYGPGMSSAIAEKFGAEGFAVGLVARSTERVNAGVKALQAKGVKAAGFQADLGSPAAVRAMVGKVREALGPITVLQWSAYTGAAGDLLTADDAALHTVLDVATTGLIAGVQAALPDLKKESGAVLIANGGLGYFEPTMDAMAVEWGAMGLAVANSAKHKLAALLHHKLRADTVYVGEVVVNGLIKGTAFDQGNATIDPKTIADKFWSLYGARKEATASIG